MADPVLREGTLADAEAIAELHIKSWKSTYDGIVPDHVLKNISLAERAQEWTMFLETAGRFVYLLHEKESEKPIGIGSGGPLDFAHPVYDGRLYNLHVLKGHQGRNLGRRLMQAVSKRLSDDGMKAMFLWVFAANSACRFYEAMGGKPVLGRDVEMGGVKIRQIGYGWLRIPL